MNSSHRVRFPFNSVSFNSHQCLRERASIYLPHSVDLNTRADRVLLRWQTLNSNPRLKRDGHSQAKKTRHYCYFSSIGLAFTASTSLRFGAVTIYSTVFLLVFFLLLSQFLKKLCFFPYSIIIIIVSFFQTHGSPPPPKQTVTTSRSFK